MKKAIAVILTLCLSLMLLPAVAEEGPVTWYLVEMNMGGESINPADLDISMTMTLNPDGTANITDPDGEHEGSWVLNEDGGLAVTYDESTGVFTEQEGMLVSSEDGMTMTFSREIPQAAALPEPVAAESEEAFLGTWAVTGISMGGGILPASIMGMESSYVIEPGKATEYTDSENPTENTEYTTEFKDGTLVLSRRNPLYPLFGEELIVVTLVLNDNGSLSYTQVLPGDDSVPITMYMEKGE